MNLFAVEGMRQSASVDSSVHHRANFANTSPCGVALFGTGLPHGRCGSWWRKRQTDAVVKWAALFLTSSLAPVRSSLDV
jgi:hypothetical protein